MAPFLRRLVPAACVLALALLGGARHARAAACPDDTMTAFGPESSGMAPEFANVVPNAGDEDLWVGSFRVRRTGGGGGAISFLSFILAEYGTITANTGVTAVRVYFDNDNNYRGIDTGLLVCGPITFDALSNANCDLVPDQGVDTNDYWLHVAVDLAADAPVSTVGVRIDAVANLVVSVGDCTALNATPLPLGTVNILAPTVASVAPNLFSSQVDPAQTLTVTGTNYATGNASNGANDNTDPLRIRDFTDGVEFTGEATTSSTVVTGTFDPSGVAAGSGKVLRVCNYSRCSAAEPGVMEIYSTASGVKVTSVAPTTGQAGVDVDLTLGGRNFKWGGASPPVFKAYLCTIDGGDNCTANVCNLTNVTIVDDRSMTARVPSTCVLGAATHRVIVEPTSGNDNQADGNKTDDKYTVVVPKVYYVAKTGADAGCGGRVDNPASPFLTINAAFDCIVANTGANLTDGDGPHAIQIQDSGAYLENSGAAGRGVDLTGLTTSLANNLAIRAAAGQTPVVKADVATKDAIYLGTGAAGSLDGTKISGLVIRDSAPSGSGTAYAGVRIRASDVTIEYCTFTNDDYGLHTIAGVNNNNLTFAYNTFYQNNPQDDAGGASNRFEDDTNVSFHHNLLFSNDFGNGLDLRNVDGIEIYNNTFYSNGNEDNNQSELYIRDNGSGDSSNVTLRNNIFVMRDIRAGAQTRRGYRLKDGSQVGFAADFNVFYRDPNSNDFGDLNVVENIAIRRGRILPET
ncbi:MAG: right-handed parallel beta-helix repeat-containing protein [Nitrospirae bacterium]|nr:right-handed parallel beta-helix repeat-containing protein [Nitrospirota bacterium]